jgi:SAM-dependent methyltransferase
MSQPPNFNRLAHLYRWMEIFTFGPCLARTRFAFLDQISAARSALILGDGDGRFTARLLRINPDIQIDAVDASPAMLQSLVRRAGPQATRVRTHCADARQFHPPNPHPEAAYDLIVTHFFLDCLTTSEIQSLAATLRAAASPQALWLISEFAVPPTLFGSLIAAPIVHALYRAFALLTGLTVRTLPDHRSALRQAGFTLQIKLPRLAGLLVSELWDAHSTHGSQNPTN